MLPSIIKALEKERDKHGTGYIGNEGGNGSLKITLIHSDGINTGRSVRFHASGHGYCDNIVVFNTPETVINGNKRAAFSTTRHYHQLHLIKLRVMGSQFKATPTDCDIENIGIDLVHFLKTGELPKTLKLG